MSFDSKLSELTVRRAKTGADNKARRLFDGHGLFLLVTPTGAKYWRYKYRFEGREKLIGLGVYPHISLAEARDRRVAARRTLTEGRDPSAERKAAKQPKPSTGGDTFAEVAREWLAQRSANWVPSHTKTIIARLKSYIIPTLGERPVGEITAPEVLAVLRAVQAKGIIESAHRTHQIVSAILRYSIATNRASADVSSHLRGALPTRKVKHHSAITVPAEVGGLMRAIRGYEGSVVVRAALQLSALTFTRPGELRRAEWSEFDLDAATWIIPASRMKMRTEHIVPLARQSVELLRELHRATGAGRFVFPGWGGPNRPLSENGVSAALRVMGFSRDKMTAHGFRSLASTNLNAMGFNRDWIERQLAHSERDAVRGAYNRFDFLEERRRMMQSWADRLDALAAGEKAPLLRETPL